MCAPYLRKILGKPFRYGHPAALDANDHDLRTNFVPFCYLMRDARQGALDAGVV
jgi:hypothetical protein